MTYTSNGLLALPAVYMVAVYAVMAYAVMACIAMASLPCPPAIALRHSDTQTCGRHAAGRPPHNPVGTLQFRTASNEAPMLNGRGLVLNGRVRSRHPPTPPSVRRGAPAGDAGAQPI